jgi:hypothetical protein
MRLQGKLQDQRTGSEKSLGSTNIEEQKEDPRRKLRRIGQVQQITAVHTRRSKPLRLRLRGIKVRYEFKVNDIDLAKVLRGMNRNFPDQDK